MIDIHSHLLYGVDDGARTIEESIEIIKKMQEYGYTDIILTPHYINNSNYNSLLDDNIIKLNNLKNELKKENINVNLYLGNEIYIDHDIYNLVHKYSITSLNDSKYLLIELPLLGEYSGYKDIFKDLIKSGYKVILAHPERYNLLVNNFEKLEELENIGVLFQSNIESITGRYGNNAKKLFKKLLKQKKISFLATDIHHYHDNIETWNIAKKKILKIISLEEYNDLVNNNAKILIN